MVFCILCTRKTIWGKFFSSYFLYVILTNEITQKAKGGTVTKPCHT